MDTNDLNNAIDRVARSLTAAEPAPDFAARVGARLDAARPARRPWIVPALAAAVVVVAATAAIWTGLHRDARPVATIAAVAPQPEPIVAGPPAASSPADIALKAPARNASAPAFASSVQGVPPLDAVEAITQDPIQPEKLTIPQLTVEAIVMPPVDGAGSIR